MSKYIIEIPDGTNYIVVTGRTDHSYFSTVKRVYELEELNSDYINEHYGDLQDEAYKRGLEAAWNVARKLAMETDDGGVSINALYEMFGTESMCMITKNNTVYDAIDKLKAYEDKQDNRIEVGDEVKWNSDIIVITRVYEDGGFNWCDGISQDGRAFHVLAENIRKTGRHYDHIGKLLEAIRA